MAHPRKGSKAILDDQDETDGSGGSYKVPEIPLEEVSLDGDLLLSRYIKNLPSGRLTRSRQAASGTNEHEAKYPVKVLATSFDQLSTSDYSSNVSNASSKDRRSNDNISTTTSPESDLYSNDYTKKYSFPHTRVNSLTDVEVQNLSENDWDTDNDIDNPDICWEHKANFEYFISQKAFLVQKDNFRLLIPPSNLQSLPNNRFSISLLTADHLMPVTSLLVHHVSPIVQISPEGLIFEESHPAYLFIPLDVEVEDPSLLSCLFSNTDPSHPPFWQQLSKDSFHYHDGMLVLQTCYLSMFTVIYEEPKPTISKKIRRRIGGSLKLDSHIGLQVTFPRGSCQEDIEAKLKVFYDCEPYNPTIPSTNKIEVQGSLACPIIMLGPHGYHFNVNRKPVEVELPVPHYREILELFPRARLVIYQSSTREGDAPQWEKVDVDRVSIHSYKHGLTSVSFPVFHFSFFKIVWDILTNKLYEAKMGVSYFSPWISFPMKCQAYMEENPKTNAFGLEVICYNSENNPEQIQNSNYPHCVGTSLKPKLVKPGRILIKLKSGKFRSDIEAGEDEEMEKEECDFRGRDFEKQFACIFKDDFQVDRGTFGKVIVDRVGSDKQKLENLFEFNLKKSGKETEKAAPENSDRWSVVAVKELAGHMNLHEDVNWKKFASYIGFTKQEIKSKLQFSGDPFLSMMNLYQERGGTPEEFVQALYSVSRDNNLGSSGCGTNNTGTPNSSSSGISGSGSQNSYSNNSQASGANNMAKRFSFFGLNPWRNNEDSDSGTADMHAENSPANSKTKKVEHSPPSGSKDSRKRPRQFEKPPSMKRRKVDGNSWKGSYKDDSYSSSDESGNEAANAATQAKSISTERHQRNPYKLSDQDLWQISAHMSAINWRALGRTLGLEESILLNLEHAHKGSGFRECAYQMLLEWKGMKPKTCTFGSLYSGLCQEKMHGVAKHMATLYQQGTFKNNV
eukprot:TRINITY_DN17039_c0_g1_i1.p1 TRINITY_DN17039_c0_g1~~TRINITY_DN17039_c0_g1_i1.p1  ORF type:complete len:960 (-),score=170.98 TRINITY_DN17039_c0_g1_i1:174-3053(-)